MKISELQAKQGNVDITIEVTEKDQPREFEKFGKKGKVCNVKVKDDTGSIKLTLWNEDIDRIDVGDKLNIKNGYVNEWQGEKQLTTGKFGTIEKLEKDELKKEIQELEKEDQKLESLDSMEKEIAPTEEPKEDLTEEFKELEKEKEEFKELEEMAEKTDDEPIKKDVEDAITLDELEEVEIVENKEPPKDDDAPTKDEDELPSDVVEEDVVDIEDEEKKDE